MFQTEELPRETQFSGNLSELFSTPKRHRESEKGSHNRRTLQIRANTQVAGDHQNLTVPVSPVIHILNANSNFLVKDDLDGQLLIPDTSAPNTANNSK